MALSWIMGSILIGMFAMAGCPTSAPTPAEDPQHRAHSTAAGGVEGIPMAVRIYFRPLPDKMPASEGDTPEMISLGRKLFFERAISLNKSQSCNDCHRLDHEQAGVDYLPTSKGAKGTLGKRNAPTVLNAGFEMVQFWDGRAGDLVEQAKGPMLNPDEMGMRSAQDVETQLAGSPEYRRSFALAFGEPNAVSFHNVARAIAAFERTLVTPSCFDRYLQGQLDAITDKEMQGLNWFVDTGCVECHSSRPVGGRQLRKLGVYHPYENTEDNGRFEITHQEEDRFVFKVCMLRNVTLTAPYFHDGRISTLPEAVRQMAWLQLDTKLAPREIDEIIRFLRTLEGESPIEAKIP